MSSDKIDLFSYQNYKKYLVDYFSTQNEKQKGYKQKMASHVGCQPSYLSQVLHGKPHLTLEQAQRLSHYFAHTQNEMKFFILMVEKGRAGTRELQKYFLDQMKEMQEARFHLKNRLAETGDVPLHEQNIYYSTWYYSAIHVLLSIPEFQTPQSIAAKLHLPIHLVADVIGFLEKNGLIIPKENGHYEFSNKRLHLSRESAFIQRHHINWRSQALQSVEKNLPQDLHFSTVIAIAKNDFEKIKEIMVQSIENCRTVIKPSPEEELYAITMDAFEL